MIQINQMSFNESQQYLNRSMQKEQFEEKITKKKELKKNDKGQQKEEVQDGYPSKRKAGDTVFYHFEVMKLLGVGGFGEVYQVKSKLYPKDKFAVKSEDRRKINLMEKEKNVLLCLMKGEKQVKGISKLLLFGQEKYANLMMMELLGQSIYQIMKKFYPDGLSLKTVAMAGIQLLERIQFIHSKGLLHCDVSPSNIVIGPKGKQNIIYIIDFGLVKRYLDENANHVPFREGLGFYGSLNYASIGAHLGQQPSRKHDLEGLAYVLIRMLNKSMPWFDIKNSPNNKHLVLEEKRKFQESQTFKNLHICFKKLYLYIMKLGFNQNPNYEYLRRLLKKIGKMEDFEIDYKFDWMV